VLDEPTNHLDLWARDALENALTQFGGTVLFVSHDRYFVNRVADHLLMIEPDGIRVIEGNYDSYQMLLGRTSAGGAEDAVRAEAPPPAKRSAKAEKKPEKKSKKASKRPAAKRRFPYRKVADLENEIFERETCLEELQRGLTEPSVLRDGEQVRQIKVHIEQEQAAIKNLYAHWEEATELNW
jgi:ATP-binding cassette subfamily F protein 3